MKDIMTGRKRWAHASRELFDATPAELRFLVSAWVLAPVVSFGITRVGFSKLLQLLSKIPHRRGPAEVGIERGEALTTKAFRVGAPASACLERAIAQYVLHAWNGPEPRLVIGVKVGSPTPRRAVDAHAWVERAGGVPREPAFRPLLALTPSGGLERFDGGT